MRGEFEKPNGLFYHPNFISPAEEQKLVKFFSQLEFEQVMLHGQAAKRTVKHFGYHYNYQKVSVEPGEPFPEEIVGLAQRCAEWGEIDPATIVQCLVSNYPPNSTIGWHTDKLLFGTKIFGISFQSPCLMRFQRKTADKRLVYEIELEPRSAYILSGEVRYKWQHSIPPTPDLRFSLTFRTLKN